MKTREIKIEKGARYLSDTEFKSLPANCIFDKGKVGCGGTTLAIESNKPYVIAVPFVTLVENKALQHPNIFPVYAGVTQDDIKKYVANAKVPIIITTYDSLEKVTKSIFAGAFNILVDELHLLFLQYSFRTSAVMSVLNLYKEYKEYCFMTATILEEEFILEELKELPIVTAIWDNTTEVHVKSVRCLNGVFNTTVDTINDFLQGKEEGNAYIFVNSVAFIKDILEATQMTYEDCNVVYSKYNKTQLSLERGNLPSFKDGRIAPKKINLLTSTVFEGTDIYDENGKIFIISDATKANTLVDISTSFQQIAGRIRNSKYINNITHYFTNTRYSDINYDEFKAMSAKETNIAKSIADEYNNLSKEARERMAIVPNETYIAKLNNNFLFDPNLVKVDLYNFKVCKHLYKIRVNNLLDAYEDSKYVVSQYTHTSEVKYSPKDLEGFDTVVKTLQLFYNPNIFKVYSDEQQAYIDAAFLRFSFLENAINKLGFEGIEEQGYIQTNIKRKLTTILDVNIETKIFKLLKSYNDITVGSFVPAIVAKKRLQEIYNQLNLSLKAKGSDLNKFFNCNETTVRVNGKITKGYVVGSPKIIFNN